MDDNLSLSDKIKARYVNQYAGVFYDRYICGLWVVAEGIIYDMFDKEKHVLKTKPKINQEEYKYISCDYGTQNPMVFLLWEKGVNETWYATKEYYYSGRKKKVQRTDGQYADDLVEFIGNLNIEYVVIDPSAASFIAELRSRGINVKRARNDVKNGIREVSNMLNKNQLGFLESCKMTINEFAVYVWDSKATDRGEDAPIKENDHCMDAIRYFVNTILINKNKFAWIIGCILGCAFQVLGYALFETILYGFPAAIASIPSNIIQSIVGIVIALVLATALEKSNVFKKLKKV